MPSIALLPSGPHRHIYILLTPDLTHALQVVQGVADFASRHDTWRIHCLDMWYPSVSLSRQALRRLRDGGLLLHCRQSRHLRHLHDLNWPVVWVQHEPSRRRQYVVTQDEPAIGRMGAAHLLHHGFRHLAFFGTNAPWSRSREMGFLQAVQMAGRNGVGPPRHPQTRDRLNWSQLHETPWIRQWLDRLPRPVGVMAANDNRLARLLLETCAEMGLRVPEDVAVIGVDNNELACEYAPVRLTSIEPDYPRLGWEAANMLDALMNGRTPAATVLRLPPRRIIERQTTNILAVPDPEVAGALAFIRDNIGTGINTEDVVNQISISRRALERRFVQTLGHTPAEEIRRVRLDLARNLLANTDLNMWAIAEQCGYHCRTNLTKAFTRACAQSPQKYRAACRLHSAGR